MVAQRKLLIHQQSGEVVNVIMWDPDAIWQCPHGCELADPPEDLPVGPGWRRLPDGTYAPPPAPDAGPPAEDALAARIAALEARLAQLEGRQATFSSESA